LGKVVEEWASGPKEGLIRGRVMAAAANHGDYPCMRFGNKNEGKKNEMNSPNDKSERPDGFLTA
jgi:hypothetical protein